MKRIISTSSLPVLALILVFGIVCGKLLDRQPTQAAQSAIEWEYCAITYISYNNELGDRGHRAAISYFRIDGIRKESGPLDQAADGALSKAVAKLGAEGWEMVLEGSQLQSNLGVLLYFKRPKN